eukprot:245594_1
MDPQTIKLLLAGDPLNGYSTGIIQFCGKQKNAETTTYSPSSGFAGYQYKESVKLALNLWVSCIHESFGNHYISFQNELKNISIGVYIQARLDIHICIEEMQEYAGILVDAIITLAGFKLNEILPNPSSQNAFKTWIKDKQGIDYDEQKQNNNSDDNDIEIEMKENQNEKRKKPIKWEQVKQEDLIVDDENAIDDDEWFKTLDFGNRNRAGNNSDEIDIEDEDDDYDYEYIYDDPLDQKKPYHVKKAIEAYNKKKKDFHDLRIGHEQVQSIDTYYQYSPCITYDNFSATNFLVEIHNDTDFDQLQNGLDKIEKFVKDQSHKMKELVREHFDEFVYCKDTIDSIHIMLNNHNMLNINANITNELYSIEQTAYKIYGNVLTRTKKAKTLYETLQLIKQPSFKFLFTLPQTIKYHIMMRNYDQIIRIYKRVKHIISTSQIAKNEL